MKTESKIRKPEPQTDPEIYNRDQGMRIVSYLLAGIGLYGGLGWLADHFLGTNLFLLIGILVGLAISLYMIFKRYGSLT